MDKRVLVPLGMILFAVLSIGAVIVVDYVGQMIYTAQEEIPRIKEACKSCSINATANISDCNFCDLVMSNVQT